MCDRPYYVCIIALTVYALCYSTDSCADSAESERRLTEILDYLGLSDDSPMCGASLCTMADFLLTTRPGRKYCIWCMIVSFCYLSKNSLTIVFYAGTFVTCSGTMLYYNSHPPVSIL